MSQHSKTLLAKPPNKKKRDKVDTNSNLTATTGTTLMTNNDSHRSNTNAKRNASWKALLIEQVNELQRRTMIASYYISLLDAPP